MKNLFSQYFNLLKEIQSTLLPPARLDHVFLVMGVLVALTQFSNLSHHLHLVTDTRPIITAIDNDAGIAIATAQKTQIYSDNGFTAYGTSYYRALRWIDHLTGDSTHPISTSEPSRDERHHHFLLLYVSLLSLIGLGLLLSSILVEGWGMRLLLTTLFVGSFLQSRTWSDMLVRAHPDHLLCFTIALAALASWRAYLHPESRSQQILAASAWGLVASVKLTVLLFAPAALLLLLPFLKTKLIRQFGFLIIVAFTVFSIVGFPQSPRIDGPIQFLLQQKRNVLPGNVEFLFVWWKTFWEQSRALVILIPVVFLLFPIRSLEPNQKPNWTKYFTFVGFWLLPTFLLWSREITVAFEWYPMPFIASLIMVTLIGLVHLNTQLASFSFYKKLTELKQNKIWLLALFALQPLVFDSVPRTYEEASEHQFQCRAEAREVRDRVNFAASQGYQVIADPYIPYDFVYHDSQVRMSWEMSPQRIDPNQTKMIALKRVYYSIYLPADEGGNQAVVSHIQDWEANLAFYRLFNNKTETTDPHGHRWVKTYTDKCSFEIWERAQ